MAFFVSEKKFNMTLLAWKSMVQILTGRLCVVHEHVLTHFALDWLV